jgi:hypothetical protein
MGFPRWLRPVVTHALVAACAFGGGWGLARALGRTGATPGAGGGMPGTGVRTWQAAQAESRASGQPVLLMISPQHHLCPPARSLTELLFEGEGLARISQGAIPASLEVDLEKPTREASALLARLVRYTLPCLLVVSPDGDILHRQFAGLYPVYEVDLSPRTPIGLEPLFDVERVVELVDVAVGRGEREARRLEALRADADAVGWVEAAELLEARGRVEDAAREAARAAATPLAASAALRAAQLLDRVGQQSMAQSVLVTALGRSPALPERDRMALWLDRVDGLPARPSATSPVPTLADVLASAQERQDASLVLALRVRKAVGAHVRGDRQGLPDELAWARANLASLPTDARDGVPVLEEMLLLADAAQQPLVRVELLQVLMERYPEHPAAQAPKHCTLGAAEIKAGLKQG